jgi:hypothetical protein
LTSLNYEHFRAKTMASHLSMQEVSGVRVDYAEIGYKHIEGLGVTDIKWLVGALGEPKNHLTPSSLFPHLNEIAISRHLWVELRRTNQGSSLPTPLMTDFLVKKARFNLAIAKDSQARRERTEHRNAYSASASKLLNSALAASQQKFVVVELSTDGQDYNADPIQRIFALRVSPHGEVLSEFSADVSSSSRDGSYGRAPDEHALNGSVALKDAIAAFREFIEGMPVFVFNGYIPEGFLARACDLTGHQRLTNPIYDVMELAREAIPGDSLRLADLSQEIGAEIPEFSAPSRARAILAVLLAARERLSGP